MKRGRNQRRRQGVNPNRALDSNGPDVRIRGTASQIYDKYLALARDASSSGDRVKAESYLQHAEHYFRVIRAMQPQQPANQHGAGHDVDGDQPSIDDHDDEGRNESRRAPEPVEAASDDSDDGDEASEDNAAEAAPESNDAEAEQARRPRRRRPQRRPRADSDEPAAAAE